MPTTPSKLGTVASVPPELVGPARITVRQGAIVEVILPDTGEAGDPAYWYTINELLDFIPGFADNDEVEDITAEYDPTLGFPTAVEVSYGEDVLDAGSTFTVSAVSPAP